MSTTTIKQHTRIMHSRFPIKKDMDFLTDIQNEIIRTQLRQELDKAKLPPI